MISLNDHVVTLSKQIFLQWTRTDKQRAVLPVVLNVAQRSSHHKLYALDLQVHGGLQATRLPLHLGDRPMAAIRASLYVNASICFKHQNRFVVDSSLSRRKHKAFGNSSGAASGWILVRGLPGEQRRGYACLAV